MTLNIDVHNVTQRFNGVTALDDISFSLGAGKIYGLLGRNGSGKSTLLSIIAAFRKPTAGSVDVGGEPVLENPRIVCQIALIRDVVDTVSQTDPVRNAIGYASCMRPNWDGEFATRLLERFGIPPERKIRELSRGQRSALGITLGLAARAPLTMFDESYLGLDAPSRYFFYDELLADYIRHPRTIIISTHLIEEVSKLFEEVLIIEKGRLLLQEETERLVDQGASITGPTEVVERFTNGRTVLSLRQLGPTSSAMVFGAIGDSDRREATRAGLELGPIALQDLFVHLTAPKGEQK